MKVYTSLLSIVAVLSLLIMLFIAVEGRTGETCQCYYIGDCYYDENNIGYRYYWCGGACAAYGSWEIHPRCIAPELKVIGTNRTITVR